jgi:hypothetical protein
MTATQRIQFLVLAPLLAVAFSLEAQVYRCESGDGIVFSDRPCADDAEEYQPLRGISLIEPDANLDQVAERNQAYLRERRERQDALRQARLERARSTAEAPVHVIQERPVSQVFFVPERDSMPRRPDRAPRSDPPRDGQPPEREQRSFSALSGPFPGTRRSDDRTRRNDPDDN